MGYLMGFSTSPFGSGGGSAVNGMDGTTAWAASPHRVSAIALDLPSLRKRILAELTVRAHRPEKLPGGDEARDQAIMLAFAVRARIELLRAHQLDDAAYDQAKSAAQSVLAQEAAARVAAGHPQLIGRGWGTAKPIVLGPVAVSEANDAYSTGAVLGSLAELAVYEHERGELAAARELGGVLFAVADDWLAHRYFRGPEGAASFEKIATDDARIRRYHVHNTDALLGRALLVLSEVAQRLGEPARAMRYREVALAVGQTLKRLVIAPLFDEQRQVVAARWVYAHEQRTDGKLEPGRGEDTNHAAYVLDFVALAIRMELGKSRTSPALFDRAQLDALGSLLATVFIEDSDGGPAYEVFVEKGTVDIDSRGKTQGDEFSLRPGGTRVAESTWYRELSGQRRSIDLGRSIRTSWGWAEAVKDQPRLYEQLGRYLLARSGRGVWPANLFLAGAVWWRANSAMDPISP